MHVLYEICFGTDVLTNSYLPCHFENQGKLGEVLILKKILDPQIQRFIFNKQNVQ
jgi:hypothetical protein